MVVCFLRALMCCVIISNFATATPHLLAPTSIRAFSYDVAVHVNNATAGDIVELFSDVQTEAITAQVITKASEPSTLIFNCGYFFHTGVYFFKIRTPEGQILTTTSPITATEWPEVTITWVKNHIALTTDVKVSLSVEGSICKSDIARQKQLSLKLKRSSQALTEASTEDNETTLFPLVLSTETFIPSYFILPCEFFQEVGTYEAELIVTSSHDNVTLAVSDTMNVEWSKEYDLKISKDPFPCEGSGVEISLMFPPCASPEDSVRLVSVVNGDKKVVARLQRGNTDRVTFPCPAFYLVNQTVEGFCFEYVVKAGRVMRTICEPVDKSEEFEISGSWSPWDSWSSCSRQCQKTIERRKRLCNDPRPHGNGRKCLDSNGAERLDELDFQEKEESDCELQNDVAQLTSLFDKKCECGCPLPQAERGVIISSLTNDCEASRTILWTVSVPKGHVIKFQLSDYQLASDEMLTVRDGRTSWPMTSQYRSAMSRNNIVVVQWVKSKVQHNLNSCGFILSYEATVKPTTKISLTSVGPKTRNTSRNAENGGLMNVERWFQDTIAENPVVIGGISACALIILAVVGVVIVHCRRKQKTKIPAGCQTPMNARLSMPPDGRSCSNDDTESEPMVRPRPIGNAGNYEVINDTCVPMQSTLNTGTAYYLAQRQLELMKRLGKDEHSQTYATGCLTENELRQQEDLLFGDRKSLHKNEDLRVS